jgi:hypothetical protein
MTSGQVIDAYLDQVGAALPGPPRARADIMAELRSGLLDAVDARRCAGLPMAAAAEAAITEFGDPKQVAASFRPELTVTRARRLAFSLAATAPPIGLLWLYAAQASQHTPPWQWTGAPPVLLTAAAFLIAVWTALATVAATGRLTRWLPYRPRIAAATAAAGGFGAAAADLLIFVLLAHQLAVAPGALAPVPVAAAAIASMARLAFARRAAHGCLAARAALT